MSANRSNNYYAASSATFLRTHTHTYTRTHVHAHASPQRRLRRKVVYSFSFSQNKMDCSLTKTVSRGTACAREQRFASENEASTWHASLYHICLSRSDAHCGERCIVVAPTSQPFTVNTHETSESNAHCHAVGNAARLLKNSQNRYEYNAFTLFTHSLARVLVPRRTRFFTHLCRRRAKRISHPIQFQFRYILNSFRCHEYA